MLYQGFTYNCLILQYCGVPLFFLFWLRKVGSPQYYRLPGLLCTSHNFFLRFFFRTEVTSEAFLINKEDCTHKGTRDCEHTLVLSCCGLSIDTRRRALRNPARYTCRQVCCTWCLTGTWRQRRDDGVQFREKTLYILYRKELFKNGSSSW